MCCSVIWLINLPDCAALPDSYTGTGRTANLGGGGEGRKKKTQTHLIINIVYQMHSLLSDSTTQNEF